MPLDPTERGVDPFLLQTGIRTVCKLVLASTIHDENITTVKRARAALSGQDLSFHLKSARATKFTSTMSFASPTLSKQRLIIALPHHLLGKDTFRKQIMGIVQDFVEKLYNNGKTWKSSRILRENLLRFRNVIFLCFLLFFFSRPSRRQNQKTLSKFLLKKLTFFLLRKRFLGFGGHPWRCGVLTTQGGIAGIDLGHILGREHDSTSQSGVVALRQFKTEPHQIGLLLLFQTHVDEKQ